MAKADSKRVYVKNASQLIAASESLLGTVPDREVAEKLGVSTASVANYRRAKGIAASKSRRSRSAKKASGGAQAQRRRSPSKVAAFHDLVGTVTDKVIAERAGVSIGAVQQYRRKHGIPSARAQKGGPSRAAAAPASGDYVWRVLGTEASLFVIAASLADAARQAEAANQHGGIERVGRAL